MRLGKLARFGLRRLRQEAREALCLRGGPDRTRPLQIRATVNERCNFRCRYCEFWRMERYAPEIEVDQWCEALVSLREFVGRYSIQFSGGEPFLKRGFYDLLEWCGSHGVDWGVITNGSTLTPVNARRIAAARPLNVDISVDAADASVHDAVRGVQGSREQLAVGIGHLIAARTELGLDFVVRIKTTVHRLNVWQLPEIVDWAVAVGADLVDFSPVAPWSPEVETQLWVEEDDRPVDCTEARWRADRNQRAQAAQPAPALPARTRRARQASVSCGVARLSHSAQWRCVDVLVLSPDWQRDASYCGGALARRSG